MGPRDDLNVSWNRKIACPYRDSNTGLCSVTEPNEYNSPPADARFCSPNILRIIKARSTDVGTHEDQKFV